MHSGRLVSYDFPDHPREWKRTGIRGIGRFVTELELIDETGQLILWNARRHRKGLGPLTNAKRADRESLTRHLNQPIATRFIIGAGLFFLASLLSLLNIGPAFTQNLIYFIGSVFFTLAAYLQYLQSINNSEDIHLRDPSMPWRWWAWLPQRMDFWVVFTQLIGTIFFNFNTLDGFISHTTEETLLGIWMPDILGSILFLISGALGVIEFNHDLVFWPRRSLQSSITIINFWGCILFMGSAIVTLVVFLSPSAWSTQSSLAMTAAGALAFLSASGLMLFEK